MDVINVRPVNLDDAKKYLDLCIELDNTSRYMLLLPGERRDDLDAQKKRLRSLLACCNSSIFVVERDNILVGYCSLTGGRYLKNHHSAWLACGVLPAYQGQGLASALMSVSLDWARSVSLHRIELTVCIDNDPAVSLYVKYGFHVEGCRRSSIYQHGIYLDEFYMALVFSP